MLMQRYCFILLLALSWLVCPMGAFGQTDRPEVNRTDSLPARTDTLGALPLSSAEGTDAPAIDATWMLPVSTIEGLGGYGLGTLSPWGAPYGDASWRLHKGFNAQFGLSVSAGWGKHALKGVGFGQNAAFAYVAPITPKLTVAAGLFASNLDWGAWRRTDVGIGGLVAYEVNDRINLYAYGSKSFVPRANDFQFRRDPFALFLQQQRDRIGAAAEFKIGQNAMIGVSVERSSY